MSARLRTLLFLGVLLPVGLGSSSCAALLLTNQTGKPLVPYPVVTDPPPPHREARPDLEIAHLDSFEIDPEGFNPLFYAEGVTDPTKANSIFLGLDLVDADPLVIQYRVFHYRMPPGLEGTDPALQPILLHEGFEEVESTDVTVFVGSLLGGQQPPPGGWEVRIVED